MEKNIIKIPFGIRFLSDWEDFKFNNFPNRCIIDKQIPGCGFTEYCLSGPDNLILCSPRIMLIKNKKEQHEGEVYILHNGMEKDNQVDKDISKTSKTHGSIFSDFKTEEEKRKEEEERKERNRRIYEKIYSEVESYYFDRTNQRKPLKIIVTYDSYHLIFSILNKIGIMNKFKTVIDEFQSILHDARFKATTEIGFLEYLKQSPTSYFVSATPMLDDYIEMLDEFKGLPYYVLDWGSLQPGRIIKPSLKVLYMDSVVVKANEIIQNQLSGNYEVVNIVKEDGSIEKIESKEIVLYVNSVNHIIAIIKKTKLSPDQVNILCANTDENKKKIKKRLGAKYTIGSVPLRGAVHKMFTFCTRTVYLGADFYSTCAKSYIFSDSNIDCMAVDIAEDLPQILGRQRLTQNPWKNCATLYYKTSIKDVSQEEFDKILKVKIEKTNKLLETYSLIKNDNIAREAIVENYKTVASADNYKKNYVSLGNSLNYETGKYEEVPVFNNLVYVNELRAFRIAQIDYKDRFSVFATVSKSFTSSGPEEIENKLLTDYLNGTNQVSKMKVLCESGQTSDVIDSVLKRIPDGDELKSYFLVLGPEKIKATGYNISFIMKEFNKRTFHDVEMYKEVFEDNRFKPGSRIEKTTLKEYFRDLYNKYGYKASPKATNLRDYFNIKDVLIPITDENGSYKRVKGFEVLGYNIESEYYKEYQEYLNRDQSNDD